MLGGLLGTFPVLFVCFKSTLYIGHYKSQRVTSFTKPELAEKGFSSTFIQPTLTEFLQCACAKTNKTEISTGSQDRGRA